MVGLVAKAFDCKQVFHLIVCKLRHILIRSSSVQHQVKLSLFAISGSICSRNLQLFFEGKALRIVWLSTGSGGSISHGMDPDVNTEGKVTGSKFLSLSIPLQECTYYGTESMEKSTPAVGGRGGGGGGQEGKEGRGGGSGGGAEEEEVEEERRRRKISQ